MKKKTKQTKKQIKQVMATILKFELSLYLRKKRSISIFLVVSYDHIYKLNQMAVI
jgi:hypothetical protein